jgi:hypothetical protein
MFGFSCFIVKICTNVTNLKYFYMMPSHSHWFKNNNYYYHNEVTCAMLVVLSCLHPMCMRIMVCFSNSSSRSTNEDPQH